MRIEVRLFAGARESLGQDSVSVECGDSVTVGELKERLRGAYPQLEGWLSRSRFAIDNRFANDKHDLTGAEEIALIPPVSGG